MRFKAISYAYAHSSSWIIFLIKTLKIEWKKFILAFHKIKNNKKKQLFKFLFKFFIQAASHTRPLSLKNKKRKIMWSLNKQMMFKTKSKLANDMLLSSASTMDERTGDSLSIKKLSNLLKLPKAQRWICCEFFYSDIDRWV